MGQKFSGMETIFSSEDVKGTVLPVYSRVIPISYGGVFAFYVQASSSGGKPVDLVLQLQQSYDDTASNFVVPENFPNLISLSDTNAHIDNFSPLPMKYMRIAVTDGGSNGDDITLTMKIFQQQDW